MQLMLSIARVDCSSFVRLFRSALKEGQVVAKGSILNASKCPVVETFLNIFP